jgi:homoserine kinase type II
MDRSQIELESILARYPADVRQISAIEPLGNHGGSSGARLWRFRSGRGLLVARLWPRDGPAREHLQRVHSWLAQAETLDFVPVPIPDRDGRTLHDRGGRLWELTRWLPGAADRDRLSADRLRAAFAALATFHQALAALGCQGPSPGLARRHDEVIGLLAGEFDRFDQALAASTATEAAPAHRWLGLARLHADSVRTELARAAGRKIPLQPSLRDARPDHFLFEGDTLTGLVDFGAMDVDCVAGDLARLLSLWAEDDAGARAIALDAYASGRALGEVETSLIPVFERSAALLTGARWTRWHFCEGRRFEDPGAALQGLERAVEQLLRHERR